jgi:hypothetical protein
MVTADRERVTVTSWAAAARTLAVSSSWTRHHHIWGHSRGYAAWGAQQYAPVGFK